MELLQLLKDSLNKETTLRQAFSCFGINKAAKRYELFKEMNENTVFACIMNSIIHKMPNDEGLSIRFKAEDRAYQARIGSHTMRFWTYKYLRNPSHAIKMYIIGENCIVTTGGTRKQPGALPPGALPLGALPHAS